MRIPVLFGVEPGAADAVLVEDGHDMPAAGYALRFTAARPGHALRCACCTLRGPAADALGRMFMDRARGAAPFFKRVVVLASDAGMAEVRRALAEDVVTVARYRDGGV